MIINHIRCTQKAICTFHFPKLRMNPQSDFPKRIEISTEI